MTDNLSLLTILMYTNKNLFDWSFPRRRESRESFTLIELLVVLALVAILSVVVVMTLNPAELLKQARDSNRLSDLSTINTALNLFSADVSTGFMGTSTVVYVSIPSTLSDCSNLGLPTLPATYTYNCVTTANLRNTNGTGWIPVNFQKISANSPISQLPIDPINTTSTGNYYTYVSGGSWELTSNMESSKQKSVTGATGTDGGVSLSSYEFGNNLRLIPSGLLEWKRDSSLVGYWTFDEGSGTTAYDYSGYGNNGSWHGSGSHWVSGKFGASAASFNGMDDYYLLNEKFSFIQKTANFTISVWAKFYDYTIVTQYIMGNSPGNNEQGFFHGTVTGKLKSIAFTASGGGYVFDSTSNQSMPVDINWHNILITANGTSAKYYIDGVADSAITNITAFSNEQSTRNLTIGKINTYNGGLFNGNLDDVRIYNRALSAAEISALYNSTK